MKTRTILSLITTLSVTLLLGACANAPSSSSPLTAAQASQGITTILGIANYGLGIYTQYAQVKSGAIPAAQVPSIASADFYGLAALAQGAIGQTPAQANIVQGAANPVPAAAIVAALPQTAITQATVNQLYSAAALVAAKSASIQGNPPLRIATRDMTRATLYSANGDRERSLVK